MPANRANIAWYLDNMISAPAGVATVKTIFKSEDGILLCYGTTDISDNTVGYASGCVFIKVGQTAGADKGIYVNEGTNLLSAFAAVNTG